jgi:hypothetical protein
MPSHDKRDNFGKLPVRQFRPAGIPTMSTKSFLLGAALAVLCWQSPAHGALGGDVRSVGADLQLMHGQIQMTSMQQYDLHEITTSGGTLIHEYVTPQGKVFAVTWRGSFPPNLQQLFGSYFDQYQTAAAASAQMHPGMHRMLTVTQPDFVMQSIGRARAFHGKAYVPSLVPSGVAIATLQ